MKHKKLFYLGVSIPLLFWGTTFICAYMLGNYNHLTQMVSELGALGTISQNVFTVGLVLCAAFSFVFILGLLKKCKQYQISTIPVLIILSYSVSIAGAGIFPMPTRLHMIMGIPSILLILSPLAALILWKGKIQIPNIGKVSILVFFIMSLGFLAFMPDTLSNYPGLKQRFFHVGWSVWFIYLGHIFTKLANANKKENGLTKH